MEYINIGNTPNDNLGDPLRTAFDKINKNFAELTDEVGVLAAETTSLVGLSDVSINAPSDGQVVTWNQATSKWVVADAAPKQLPSSWVSIIESTKINDANDDAAVSSIYDSNGNCYSLVEVNGPVAIIKRTPSGKVVKKVLLQTSNLYRWAEIIDASSDHIYVICRSLNGFIITRLSLDLVVISSKEIYSDGLFNAVSHFRVGKTRLYCCVQGNIVSSVIILNFDLTYVSRIEVEVDPAISGWGGWHISLESSNDRFIYINNNSAYITKFDIVANQQVWQRSYSASIGSETSSSLYISYDKAIGKLYGVMDSTNGVFLCEINESNGDVISSKFLDISPYGVGTQLGTAQFTSIEFSPDGGNFYLIGRAYRATANSAEQLLLTNIDMLVMKISSTFNIIWQKTVGTEYNENSWWNWSYRPITTTNDVVCMSFYTTSSGPYSTSDADTNGIVVQLRSDGSDAPGQYGQFRLQDVNIFSSISGSTVLSTIPTPRVANLVTSIPTIADVTFTQSTSEAYTYTTPISYAAPMLEGVIGTDRMFTLDYSLPIFDGKSNEVLKTDGNGTLTWTTMPSAGEESVLKYTSTRNNYWTLGSPSLSTSGYDNFSFGYNGMPTTVSGEMNVGIGNQTLRYLSTGTKNIAIGFAAAQRLTTGSHNISIGYNSLTYGTTANNNVSIGSSSLANITTGYRNIGIGHNSLSTGTTFSQNTSLGFQTGNYISGSDNTFIGNNVASANYGSAYQNVMIGSESGLNIMGGYSNTTVGYRSGNAITTGNRNVAIGNEALLTTTNALVNVAVGHRAGRYASGNDNVYIGGFAASANISSGQLNTAVGGEAALNITSGYNNAALGYGAIRAITTGGENTALGFNAGYALTTAVKNIFIGYTAGDAVTTGSRNTIIGDVAGSANLQDTVIIAAGMFERIKVDDTGLYINGTLISSTSQYSPLSTVTGTTYTAVTADGGKYIRFTTAGSKTITFNSANSYASPQEYHIVNRSSSGDLTISGVGVTFNPPRGGTLVLAPGDTVTVKFISSTEADVFGSSVPS